MSEEKNIPGKELATGNKQVANDHFPEDSHAPVTGDSHKQPALAETLADKQATENMEVHKHPHHVTHKKKWGEYLLEFLMLFLAVFLGFLAENQREHYVEHQREKKYAAQLYKELKFDTLAFSEIRQAMQRELKYYDSVSLLFQQQVAFTDDEFVRIARNLWASYNPFSISTTFNQMKSSGSLRYIRNTDLSGSLSDYYDILLPKLLTFFEYINEKLHTQIEPFFAKHFDLSVTKFYFASKPDTLSLPPNLRYYDRTKNSDLLIKNYYKLYYNGVHFICHDVLKYLKERATELLKELQKEYRLE